ncbi:MAG: two-component system response regulator, partial [Candidatus Kapaibacteriota bacterium]
VITTDHGSVQIKHPVQIIGDKNVNTNLRYKQGKTLTYDEKEVYTIDKPEKAHLPKIHINQKFVFALNHDYFVYPNNYNHFVKYFQDTFQHGGISMEEMIIPIIYLEPKN